MSLNESTAKFKTEAAAYTFTEAGSTKPLDFQKQAILHWSNPARNGEDGTVFVWTADKIPKVVGTCFTFNYQNNIRRKHAFHLLSGKAMEGKHGDSLMWSPPEKSFHLIPLPGAPDAATNATQRTI